jgi:hypothetical protein
MYVFTYLSLFTLNLTSIYYIYIYLRIGDYMDPTTEAILIPQIVEEAMAR